MEYMYLMIFILLVFDSFLIWYLERLQKMLNHMIELIHGNSIRIENEHKFAYDAIMETVNCFNKHLKINHGVEVDIDDRD
jgi:hypothetical protein